jgi:hypothetical protein
MPSVGLFLDVSEVGAYLGGVGIHLSRMLSASDLGEGTNFVMLSADFPWPSLRLSAARPRPSASAGVAGYGVSARSFRATGHAYLPVGGDQADHESKGMVGFEYRMQLVDHLFAAFDLRGAMLSQHAGYSEFTVGAGASYPASNLLSLWASAGAGGAGGGRVDVGGGLLLRGALGVDLDLPGPAHAGVDLGLQDAPLGSYRALSAGLRLGVSEDVVRSRPFGARPLHPDERIAPTTLQFRAAHRTYFELAQRRGEQPAANLVGLKLDYLFDEVIYASVQGGGSYTSETSGFVAGTVALGMVSPRWNGLRLVGEFGVGAAGGGSADVGKGLFVQPMAGLNYGLTDSLSVELLGGGAFAPQGQVRTPAADLSLVYAFSTPTVR